MRRIAPRYAFEARIRLHLQRGAQKLAVGGWSRDLSESGVGAFVAEPLQLGEHVTVELPLPGKEAIALPAMVVRSLGTQYGITFTALSASQRHSISEAVAGREMIDDREDGK